MGIAEQQRREQQQYREILPRIVEGIAAGEEPVALSAELAESRDLEQKLVYRWIQLTEEGLERRRRREATRLVVLMWPGVLAVAGYGVGAVMGWFSPQDPVAVAVVGVGACAGGFAAWRIRGVRGRAYDAWLREELDRD
tara:strand:- start:1742 stop:2158 length:417 start_codon:yes stop_codon:yes gene_type:complete